MYQILNRVNQFDNSPFQFARMDYLRGRMDQNYQTLSNMRKDFTGRLDSSHLLMKLMTNLNVEFDGNIYSYMEAVDDAAKRLCGVLGITTSYSKGVLHDESVFYDGCPEIIVYSRNTRYTVMDLWNNWREVSPIEVLTHPVTELKVIELGVMNPAKLERSDLVVVNIDIPLLAAQWKMWQSATPGGTLEAFLTGVPLVSMIKSHLNVVVFNNLLVALGIKEPCTVKGNLPFGQVPLDLYLTDIIKDLLDKLSKKALTPNQIMASIPMLYGTNYLDTVRTPDAAPTYQILWALVSQKVEPVALMLAIGKLTGYDRQLKEIAKVRRLLIQEQEDKFLTNGLGSSGQFLRQRIDEKVTQRLPA